MQEYICTVCGAIFEEENGYQNNHGCPYCGQDVELVQYCEICGKPVKDSDFTYHMCKSCEEETRILFKRFLADLDMKYQVEFLQDEIDGVYWNDYLKSGET